MKTFKEDWNSPLNEVERAWIRRPVVLIFTPFIIIAGAISGIIELCGKIYEDCW